MLDFLARECSVDWKLYTDNLRRSPEHVAALRGDVVLLKFLVEYSNKHKNPAMGCLKILPRDKFDCTPLHYMAQKGHAQLVDVYIEELKQYSRYMSLLDFDWRSKKKRMMAMELAEAVADETKK
jgi:hypothetical protein